MSAEDLTLLSRNNVQYHDTLATATMSCTTSRGELVKSSAEA